MDIVIDGIYAILCTRNYTDSIRHDFKDRSLRNSFYEVYYFNLMLPPLV